MLKVLSNNVRRAFAVLRFGLLTLRYAGLRYTIQKLGHQLYGRTVFLHTIGDLETVVAPPIFSCYTVCASPEDMKELFDQMHYESNEGKYQLLVRKWYHERGFGTPYVVKSTDTDEVCLVRWIVTSQDIEKAGLSDRFPKLEDDEVMIENVYTLERFRQKGVQTSAHTQNVLLGIGYKKHKGYIAEGNTPALRFSARRGSKVFEKVLERHILFYVTRTILEQYDPPVPVATFLDKPTGNSI